jgi:hypothetical protein
MPAKTPAVGSDATERINTSRAAMSPGLNPRETIQRNCAACAGVIVSFPLTNALFAIRR